MLTNYFPVFTEKCVEGITVDRKRCASYLDKNPSLAVFLSPNIGYLEASKIAKQALKEKRSVRVIASTKGVLKPEQARQIFKPEFLLKQKPKRKN
jgi:aspartate ammonia-lyase